MTKFVYRVLSNSVVQIKDGGEKCSLRRSPYNAWKISPASVVWTENIWSVFRVKTPFSNLSDEALRDKSLAHQKSVQTVVAASKNTATAKSRENMWK